MSLRSRVALLILVLFLTGMGVVLARTLQHAQREVGQRIDSTRQLTTQLLKQLRASTEPGAVSTVPPAMMDLLRQLDAAGYLKIAVGSAPDPLAAQSRTDHAGTAVPRWFVRLMGGEGAAYVQLAGDFNGEPVLVRTDSFTPIATIWENTCSDLLSRLGSLLMLNLVIYLMLGQWLRPIEAIVQGLQEIEKGDFGKRIPYSGLGELDQITTNINHLTTVLGASQAENVRLQSESISKGEQERLRLARELHDSLGQSITAIKAVAVSIGLRAREQMPEVADSAFQIEKISETAYATVRNMMSTLRPSVLDELGLEMALQQMADDWNLHHEDTFCRLRMDCRLSDLNDEQAINIFRIVQEALNNIAKYAQASEASIILSGNEVLTLEIEDNGVGFDPVKVKKGMGLWNIQDRVNLLQGKFQLVASPGNGLRLFMEFPREFDQRKRNQ